MTDTVRLATYLATLVSCSKRMAEQYIEGGGVAVDGEVVVEPGYRVRRSQTVVLSPDARCEPVRPVTVLLNKPAGLSTSPASDGTSHPLLTLFEPSTHVPQGEKRPFLNKHRNGLAVLTPLETGATGLVVLSQDHRVQRKLQSEADRIEQEYIVDVEGGIDDKSMASLNGSLRLDGRVLPRIKVSWQSEGRLRFALRTPEKGLIADICDQVGVAVVGMRRIRIGRVALAPLLPRQWRYLQEFERF